MSLINVISAIGNNKSIYPLLVRDCGIENPAKIAMTYKQNKDDKNIAWLATRERFIDEYSVSAVWLGIIPLIDKAGKYLINKFSGLNADVNLKLISEDEKYSKHGVHKGMCGCVMQDYAVQNYIEVDFSGIDENGNFYGDCISVKIDDLKVVE